MNKIECEEKFDEHGIKTTSFDQIAALFLYKVAPKVLPDIYKELCLFIVLYRYTLNIHGMSYQSEIKYNEKNENEEEFTMNHNGCYAPHVANNLVKECLYEFGKIVDYSNFKYIGEANEQIRYLINLCRIFCYWLYCNDYTNYKLEVPEKSEPLKNIDFQR